MEAITVRRVKAGEWSKQRNIRLRMLSEAPEAFGSTAVGEAVVADEDWRAWSKARSQGAEEAMFVALAAGEWIGCAIGSRADHDPDVARVWSMWVEPQWRSRRVGLDLLGEVRDWAVLNGYRKLWLKVAEGNRRARRLYEGFGFKETGERSGMNRDRSIPMITMEMPL